MKDQPQRTCLVYHVNDGKSISFSVFCGFFGIFPSFWAKRWFLQAVMPKRTQVCTLRNPLRTLRFNPNSFNRKGRKAC